MSSRHALPSLSFAFLSARSSRLFSRLSHCASTSIPSRSSKSELLRFGILLLLGPRRRERFQPQQLELLHCRFRQHMGSPSVVVVAAAADVLVDGGGARHRSFRLRRGET